jgi:hypothetical protein
MGRLDFLPQAPCRGGGKDAGHPEQLEGEDVRAKWHPARVEAVAFSVSSEQGHLHPGNFGGDDRRSRRAERCFYPVDLTPTERAERFAQPRSANDPNRFLAH